jgi:hypothetical protein
VAGEKSPGSRPRRQPKPETAAETSPPGGLESSARSTASPSDPLAVEPTRFEPPADDAAAADLDALAPGEEYEPAAPEPVEWTPERAGAVFRGGAFLLHQADPLGHEPDGGDLWRATEADVDAIAPPLSRILNRYAPARRLAGVSDEAELAFGFLGYAKRNLAERGRLARLKREREEALEAPGWPQPGEEEPPAA